LLIIREEHRLRVFENRMLRKIFGTKREKVRGDWRQLLNDNLNDLYSSASYSGDKINEETMDGAWACMGEK
jgi:hypothetical protein